LLVTLALLFANAPTAQAYCNTYDNGLGGQSGTCNGERINTYDNGLGGVSGTIGKSRINTYDNGLGGVSGTIGKSRVNTYNNGLGGVSGSGIGGVPGITKSNKKCVSTFTKKC
jgi:hypothetical protein